MKFLAELMNGNKNRNQNKVIDDMGDELSNISGGLALADKNQNDIAAAVGFLFDKLQLNGTITQAEKEEYVTWEAAAE